MILTCWADWSVFPRSSHRIAGRTASSWASYQRSMHPKLIHAENWRRIRLIYNHRTNRDTRARHLLVPTWSWKIGLFHWQTKQVWLSKVYSSFIYIAQSLYVCVRGYIMNNRADKKHPLREFYTLIVDKGFCDSLRVCFSKNKLSGVTFLITILSSSVR